jgi:hypothetical protein
VVKQDRFLIALLLIIALLVVLALALFFVRQSDQNYGVENSPEGIVRNYVLALQKGDYQRAYQYLAEVENKPSFTTFQGDLLTQQRDLSSISVQMGEVSQGDKQASVAVTLIHPSDSPFSGGWREQTAVLVMLDPSGAWKISRFPYPFWGASWNAVKIPSP